MDAQKTDSNSFWLKFISVVSIFLVVIFQLVAFIAKVERAYFKERLDKIELKLERHLSDRSIHSHKLVEVEERLKRLEYYERDRGQHRT